MQPIFNRSFVTLLATLALCLASCSGGDISKRRAAASAGSTGTTAQAAGQPTPGAPADPLAGLSDAVAHVMASAGVVGPAAAGTPAAPAFVWNFDSTPTQTPTATPDGNCSHTGLCGWDIMQTGGGK